MPSYFPVAHLLSWEIADPATVGIFQWPLPESPNEIAPVLNPPQKKYILRWPTSGWHGALCPAGWLIAWHRVVPQMVRDRREGEGAGGRGLIVCHRHTPHPPVIAKTTTTITLSLLFVLDDCPWSLVRTSQPMFSPGVGSWWGHSRCASLSRPLKYLMTGTQTLRQYGTGRQLSLASTSPITLGKVSCFGPLLGL